MKGFGFARSGFPRLGWRIAGGVLDFITIVLLALIWPFTALAERTNRGARAAHGNARARARRTRAASTNERAP